MEPVRWIVEQAERRRAAGTSRRAFLGMSGALATLGAAELLADEIDPVRVAFIGTGARGSDLLRNLTTIPGCDVCAVADDYPPHLKRAAEYAGPQAKPFADYRRLLADVHPQAVVIAVPLYLHAEIARECIAAGTDVFLEKTMCYSLAEARALAEEVRRANIVFQVGLQRRANPIYQQAVAMVRAGVLGEITAIQAQWHRNNNWRRPVPVGKSDPRWPELEARLNWRLYRKFSRGLLAELGSHQMDVANWILGTTPARVLAGGGIDYWNDGREVHDNVFCTYEYVLPRSEKSPEGPGASATRAAPRFGNDRKPVAASAERYTVRVTYSSLCNNAYEGASELVLGTRGTLFLTTDKGLLYRERLPDDPGWLQPGDDRNSAVLTAGKTLKVSNAPWAHRGEPLEIDLLSADDTRDELVSFLEHVRTRDRETICDAESGLRDTLAVVLGDEAAWRGGVVEATEFTT